MSRAKKAKQRPKAFIVVDCNCGMKHQVVLSLGELQVLERSIIKRTNPDLHIHIQTFAPTGRTLGNGQPEYARFARESTREKMVSPLGSSSRKEISDRNESSQVAPHQ